MNTWNQWGAAPGAATVAGYQNAAGGNPSAAAAAGGMMFAGASNPAAAVGTSAAAAAAAAGAVASPYAAMGAYGYYGNPAMPAGYGAQWPAGGGAGAAGGGGAGAAAAQWQQTQWEQWQQQYAQWQQQYGGKFPPGAAAAMMPGMPPALPPAPAALSSAPTPSTDSRAAPSSETTVTTGEKRPASDTSANESKKSKTSDGKKETLEELIEAEKGFDVQFKNWESQFEKWKEQNINHPDKTQYKEYEAKWESWREQLVQRREQMKKKREAKLEEIRQEKAAQEAAAKAAASATNPQTNAAAAAAAVVAAAAAAAASTAERSHYYSMSGPPPPPPMFGYAAPGYGAGQQFPAAMFGAPPPPTAAAPANMFNPMSLPPPPVMGHADKDKAQQQDNKNTPFSAQGGPSKDGKGIPGLDLLADGGKHFKDSSKPPPSFNPYGENKNQPMIKTSDDCKAFDFPKSKADGQPDYFKNYNVPPPPPGPGFGNPMMEGFNPNKFPPNFNKGEENNPGERQKSSRFSGPNNEGSLSSQGGPDASGQWTPNRDQFNKGGPRWGGGGDNDLPPDESSSFSRGSHEHRPDRFGRDDSNDRSFGDASPFSRGASDRFPGSRDSFGSMMPGRKGPGDSLLEKPFGFGKGPEGGLGRLGPSLDGPERSRGSPADRFGPDGDRFGPGGDRFGPEGDRFGGPPGGADRFGEDRSRGGPTGGRFGGPDDRFGGGEPRGGPGGDRFGGRFGDRPEDRFGGPPRPGDRFGRDGDDSQGFEGDKPDDELSGDGSRGRGGRFGGPEDRFGGGDGPGFRDGPGGFRGAPEGDRFGAPRDGRFGGPPGGDRFGPPEGDRFGGSPRKGLLETPPERFGPGDRPMFDGGFRGGPGGPRFERDNRFGPGPDGPEGFRDGPPPRRMGPGSDAGDPSSKPRPPDAPDKPPVSLLDLPPIKPPFTPDGPRGGDGLLGAAPDEVGRFNSPRNDDTRFPPGTPGSNSARSPWNQKAGPDKPSRESPGSYRPTTVHDYSLENDISVPGVNVIEYGHKKLPSIYDEPETLEPLKMFDYDHGSKRTSYLKGADCERMFRISDDFGSDSWREERDRNGHGGRGGRDRDRNRDGSRDRDHYGSRDRDRDRDRGDRDRPRSRERDRNRDGGRDRERERERDKDRGAARRRSRSRERANRDSAPDRDERRKQPGDNNKEDNKENEKNKSLPVPSSNSNNAEKRNRGSSGPKPRAVLVEDLLSHPGRLSRPPKILIILRGPPGSGKTFVAKLIKDKEVEEKGSAPRILSLDDYFMAETEKTELDPETGRRVTKKVMEYEYEAAMEANYRTSLLRALKKTIADGYFPFIIVDCVNDKIDHYADMYSFAVQNGFQVFITEMDLDASACVKRNIHKRTEKEIQDIIDGWERTPDYQVELDIRSLLQSAAITEVDMEDCYIIEDDANDAGGGDKGEGEKEKADSEDEGKGEDLANQGLFRSKWDNVEFTGERLDKLDGLAKARKSDNSIKDWLQLPDDYYDSSARPSKPGAKRVRWADLEERREQEKMRAIGFVVGQTDWSRMMDPSQGGSKLTQTKYI